MTRPMIAITPWRQVAPTVLRPETELFAVESHYLDAIERAGADAAMLTWTDRASDAARRLSRFDGLLLTGGQDVDPSSYRAKADGAVDWIKAADVSEQAYLRAAISQDKPILAVCRGLQVLNVAFGGSLTQHMWGRSDEHPDPPQSGDAVADADEFLARRHAVSLRPGSMVADAFGAKEIMVNSLHHQSVDRLGPGLIITGIAADQTVEAIEHTNHPAIGVQWHPEWLQDEGHDVLFAWLVEAATT
ncbi:MAG: gamma-glutamyl-gamma-aminobutyrate hydrolase family protein [Acidimicrobiales bacterium]